MLSDYEAEYERVKGQPWLLKDPRSELCRRYSWAIPCDEALSTIARYGAVVEGGAGSGYWSYLLRQRGVDVVAYDEAPYENGWVESRWTDVLVGSAEQMAQHRDRTLLLVWPPYDDRMALDHVMAHGGQTVCYVGEGEYGCTADDAFHRYMRENFEEAEFVRIPSWEHINDAMWVYRRKA